MVDMLAIGNTPVDVHVNVDEAFVRKFGLKKGEFCPASPRLTQAINTQHTPVQMIPSGAVANTAYCARQLGVTCEFVGRVANDEAGWMFYQSMVNAGVPMPPPEEKGETMHVHVLTTPDGVKTYATHGVTMPLKPEHIHHRMVERARWLLVGGYMLLEDQREACVKALNTARGAGVKIAMTLASSHVVSGTSEILMKQIHEGIDLIFANEDEMNALARDVDPTTLRVPHVVTHGENGASWHGHGETIHQPCDVVDAGRTAHSGVGDAFAAGFLAGHLGGESIQSALIKGNRMAYHALRVNGGRVNVPTPLFAA